MSSLGSSRNSAERHLVARPGKRLWAKGLLVLLSRQCEVVRIFFLACGFPFRSFLLFKLDGFSGGKFGGRIDLFGVDDELETISES